MPPSRLPDAAAARPSVVPDPALPGRRQVAAALAVMSATAFLVVTAETLPIGLLGRIASDLQVPETRVGLLVGFYALVAAATAVPATRLTARIGRRRVLTVTIAVYALSCLLAALAPTLEVLFAARAVSGVGHGLFFAVAGPALTRLVPLAAQGRAVSTIPIGTAAAFVVGVPLTTAVGQVAGWRVASAALAVAGAVLALLCHRLLPPLPALPATHEDGSDAGKVSAALRSRGLLMVMGVTTLLVIAHFGAFTYVTPYLLEQVGIAERMLSPVLLAYGVVALSGSVLGGYLADRHPVRAVLGAIVLMLLGLGSLYAAGPSPLAILPLLLWGGSFSLLVASSGIAAIRRSRHGAMETSSALLGIVFQLGIVTGSAGASLLVEHGHLSVLPLAAAVVTAVALAAALPARRAYAGPAPARPDAPAPATAEVAP